MNTRLSKGSATRILFVDAYDSFSSNIIRLLEDVLPVDVDCITIDYNISSDDVPNLVAAYEGIILGPGPGHPANLKDVGLMRNILAVAAKNDIPVLGICLGFQLICLDYGAEVRRLPLAQHGQLATITHQGSSIFQGIQVLQSASYHSLQACLLDIGATSDNLWKSTACPLLQPLAWNLELEEPVLMGVRHVTKPIWGVQFHPESVISDKGNHILIANWYREVLEVNHTNNRKISTYSIDGQDLVAHVSPPSTNSLPVSFLPDIQRNYHMSVKTLPQGSLTVPAVSDLLGLQQQDFVLLESVSKRPTLGEYSIIGVISEGYWRVQHSIGQDYVEFIHSDGERHVVRLDGQNLWDWLDAFMKSFHIHGGDAQIPFWAGFMGMFTYEMGLEKFGIPHAQGDGPDVCLALVERSIIFDHNHQLVHVQTGLESDEWLDNTIQVITDAANLSNQAKPRRLDLAEITPDEAKIKIPVESQYKRQLTQAKESLAAGDSYQLCLTGETTLEFAIDQHSDRPWRMYRSLSQRNPATFASFLALGDLTIVSSSPEEFLRRDRRGVASIRPMKGTVRKSPGMTREKAEAILATRKERAENIMIVDIVRHDLINATAGKAAVTVPELLDVESLETVYTMSSRVTATPLPDIPSHDMPSAVQTLKHCLPPASMTGAPKKRSCELLTELEQRPRGPYSGVLGYLDFGGAAQFCVLIRCAFNYGGEHEQTWRLGAGGGVTILSTEQGEWDEMLAKLEGVLNGLS